MRYPKPYYELVAIQRALLLDATNPSTTPAARAQVARAFADAEAMKRIISGKPNPKPQEVTGKLNGKKQPRPRESFSESPEAKPSCASDTTSGGVPVHPVDPVIPQV